MVVFTCGHCGESVQKPKVEKHYLTQCRNRNPNLSCMDCFKDFLGQDYESHIKCITEEERYSGKGFLAKEKKGEKKQNAWVEMLQSVLDEQKTASNNVLRIIETISKHNNTPRKKPKFINFVKNVCGHKTNAKDIDQAWDLISVKLSALSTSANPNNNQIKVKESSDIANGDENEITNKKTEKNDTKKKEKLQNGEAAHENGEAEPKNGVSESKNGDTEISNSENDEKENVEAQIVDDKKFTKKQRKEEKKRLKYEAELQKAEAPPVADEVEEDSQTISKKGKKKKNRTESGNNDDESSQAESKKQVTRQDTTGSAVEVVVNSSENNAQVVNEKTQKKKIKVVEQEAENSICLHDQNVAKGEKIDEGGSKGDKFDWHAAIMAVLVKKGDEMQFKRLQKKVLSEYSEMTGRDVDDRIADKFIKKLRSAPRVVVDKNRVYLEEKKRLKYEAELQKAEAPPVADEVEEDSQTISKKGKKKKNRTESGNNDDESSQAESKKQKKRKRQDTTGSAVEVVVNSSENNAQVVNEKTQKKKIKVVEQEAENSICLHDQNVAKGEKIDEGGSKGDKFDWHAAIMAVLVKKGDEMQFKRLQKKVLSEYSEMTGRDVDDRIADKFIKKLRSAPRVVVDKNRVYLEE